jgi:hypothetical protein
MKALDSFKLGDILTPAQIKKAMAICLDSDRTGKPAAPRITSELITPNIRRINKRTGQDNDTRYLGYAVEFALRENRPPTQAQAIDAEGFDCGDPTVCE